MTGSDEWMENARLRLDVAHLLFEDEHYGMCITQIYFAVFAAGKAVLASRGVRPKSHSGVHNALYKMLGRGVDTRLLSNLRKEREAFDYELRSPGRTHVEHG